MAGRGELKARDPDEAAALYELTQATAEAAGRPAYEISNHARPGEESRHNLAYWRYRPYLCMARARTAGAGTPRRSATASRRTGCRRLPATATASPKELR